MASVVISICIPTYNRARVLQKTLNDLVALQSENIEIIISDNCSTDNTRDISQNFHDTRVKYFRNEKNLGYDNNLIKLVQHAQGKFLFFLSDEDSVNSRHIPWLLEKIKTVDNLSGIVGVVGDKRASFDKVFWTKGWKEEKQFTSPHDALVNLFVDSFYLSGVIVKKDAIDLERAQKYVGWLYMQLVFMGQAMLRGRTLYTPRVLSYVGETKCETLIGLDDAKTRFKGKKPADPFSKLVQLAYQIRFIKDITRNMTKTRHNLIKQCQHVFPSRIIYCIILQDKNMWQSGVLLFRIFPIILKFNDLIFSGTFWLKIMYNIVFGLVLPKFRSRMR